ncbi:uncharacterized protein LOC144100100 [Amblyomma americanum]
MANAGAYREPGDDAVQQGMLYAYDMAQQAMYGPAQQGAYCEVPYPPVTPDPDLVAAPNQPESAMSMPWKDKEEEKSSLTQTMIICGMIFFILTTLAISAIALMSDFPAFTTEAAEDDYLDLSYPVPKPERHDIYIQITKP